MKNRDQLSTSMGKFVHTYASNRGRGLFAGEFWDSAGMQGSQKGLSGTCMLFELCKHLGISTPLIEEIDSGLDKAIPDNFTHLLNHTDDSVAALKKDVGRITSKTILALLWASRRSSVKEAAILQSILVDGVAKNGLIRPVLDDPNILGEPIITAYCLHIIAISQTQIDPWEEQLESVASSLSRQCNIQEYDGIQELFMRSAIVLVARRDEALHKKCLRECLHRHLWEISKHDEKNLLSFYYEDTPGNVGPRNRYVHVPESYILFVSLYLCSDGEAKFLELPPLDRFITSMPPEYSSYAEKDPSGRTPASCYFVFFIFASMNPKHFFGEKKSGYFRHLALNIDCHLGNLTKVGKVALIFDRTPAFEHA